MNLPRPAHAADASDIARLAGELGYPVDILAMAARPDCLMDDPRECLRVAAVMDAWPAGSLLAGS